MTGNVASQELLLLVEWAERIKEEIKDRQDDLKDVFSEAKSRGYDPKTIKEIIKLRALDPAERREREALLDTYKAALGMLDGTPLGKWALERLKPKPPEPKDPDEEDGESGAGGADQADAPEGVEEAEVQPVEPTLTVEDAHRLGSEAARAGQPVTSNPFPAFDERRAAWDESWCAELGSDGMDIPDALKPAPKPKGETKPGGEA
jgi:uncharacterized protein (UPF0335 family)